MISTKTCSKCRIEQPIANFSRNRCLKDGYCNWCKECVKEQHRDYYAKNRDKILALHKEYNENNKDKIKLLHASWYERHKDELNEKHRMYHREHLEEDKARSKAYYSRPDIKQRRREHARANREHIRAYQKEYRAKNREYIRKRQREYYYKNKDKTRKWKNKWRTKRQQNDPIFRMKMQARNAIRRALRFKGYRKRSKTAEILGCDLDFFCKYLLGTWGTNYGKPWAGEPYHIDHIVPLVTAKTEADVLKLCHYSNLQMLTPEDNLKKRDRV